MKRKLKKATETATESTAASTIATVSVDETPDSAGLMTVPGPSGPMCFTAKRKDLAAIVRRLATVAPRTNRTLPITTMVMMRATVNGVVFAATDLDVFMTIEAPAFVVHGGGGYCVSAKSLGETLRKLPDGDVTVRARESDRGLVLSVRGVEVALTGVSDREFPKLPPLLRTDRGYSAQEFATVDAATFRGLLGSVEHAICQDETRFHLAGVHLEYDGTNATAVATDGHRLAIARRELPRLGDFKLAHGVILREKGVDVVRRMLDKPGTCDIGMVAGMFLVRQANVSVAFKLIDAQFPPYMQVVPKDNDRLITVERAALAGALDRVMPVCSKTHGARLEVVDGALALVAEHPDNGKARETLDGDFVAARWEGASIGFNPKYLAESLASIDDERVTIALSSNTAKCKYADNLLEYQLCPFTVRATEHAAMFPLATAPYLSVVMPMRI